VCASNLVCGCLGVVVFMVFQHLIVEQWLEIHPPVEPLVLVLGFDQIQKVALSEISQLDDSSITFPLLRVLEIIIVSVVV